MVKIGKVQINIKIDSELKNEIKLYAVTNGRTLNSLLERYIKEGFEKDRESLKE